jgi:cytochrome c2
MTVIMNRMFYMMIAIVLISFCISSCNSNKQPAKESNQPAMTKTDTVVVSQGINSKGIGRFNDVKLTHPLDQGMITGGQSIFEAKCIACHKLTDEKLVGPGWKGVTDRRTPEWIMNFTTNTQVMLDKDLVAQAEMVTCVVRMPNQDLSDDQARQVLEFMRKNDGKN